MNKLLRKSPIALAIAVAVAGGHSSVQAQQLEEVIVMAQKRAESLMDVPISVSVRLKGNAFSVWRPARLPNISEVISERNGIAAAGRQFPESTLQIHGD